MVEIYIRFFPEWLDFEAKSQSLKKEGELDKAIENLEPKVVQKDHESGEAIEMTSNDKNTQALKGKVLQEDNESGEAIEMAWNDKNTQALC